MSAGPISQDAGRDAHVSLRKAKRRWRCAQWLRQRSEVRGIAFSVKKEDLDLVATKIEEKPRARGFSQRVGKMDCGGGRSGGSLRGWMAWEEG